MGKYIDFDEDFIENMIFGFAMDGRGFAIQGVTFDGDEDLKIKFISMLRLLIKDFEGNLQDVSQTENVVNSDGEVIAEAELVFLGHDTTKLN